MRGIRVGGRVGPQLPWFFPSWLGLWQMGRSVEADACKAAGRLQGAGEEYYSSPPRGVGYVAQRGLCEAPAWDRVCQVRLPQLPSGVRHPSSPRRWDDTNTQPIISAAFPRAPVSLPQILPWAPRAKAMLWRDSIVRAAADVGRVSRLSHRSAARLRLTTMRPHCWLSYLATILPYLVPGPRPAKDNTCCTSPSLCWS